MTRKHAPPVSEVSLCIHRTVKANPGIHFRGLGRAARVSSAGQLRHHLDRLERQGLLIEVEDGRFKRFFAAGDQDPKIRPEMARFSRPVPRRIARLLLVRPMNRSQLRRSLGCADSTLGYHLSRMVSLGDLARERGRSTCVYSLASWETVRQILAQQREAAEALGEPGGPFADEPDPSALKTGTAEDPWGLRTEPSPAPSPPPGPAPPPVPQPRPPPAPRPQPGPDPDGRPTPPDPMPDFFASDGALGPQDPTF